MADPITEDRMNEIVEGAYCGLDEGAAIVLELRAARAEVERLQGIIDDIEVESGHCHFLDDAEHEPPHLPNHVRAIVQERDAARAQLRDVASSGVEFVSRQYVTVQIDPETWRKIQEVSRG